MEGLQVIPKRFIYAKNQYFNNYMYHNYKVYPLDKCYANNTDTYLGSEDPLRRKGIQIVSIINDLTVTSKIHR